jgi:hypothetical protein
MQQIGLPRPNTWRGFSGQYSEESWLRLMPDAKRLYSTSKVNKAGKILIDPNASEQARNEAQEVFENWRSSHSYAMNWFHQSLTGLAGSLSNVVQRPKRLEAVQGKLLRKSHLKLGAMNDIAGVRVIVPTIDGFDRFVQKCKAAWADHELKRPDDYIASPRDTGYRSLHLIYRFKGTDPSFDGRLVEVQIRTGLQHAWATAVETVDLFQRQTLKFGTGDPDWQRFFALMGSAIAKRENTAAVPETPTKDSDLQKELRHYVEQLQVEQHMMAYGSLHRTIRYSRAGFDHLWTSDTAESGYFVMELERDSKTIQVRGYHPDQVRAAYSDVAQVERAIQAGEKNVNVVLVAASDYEKLKDAYPNWIIDTRRFLKVLKTALGEPETEIVF